MKTKIFSLMLASAALFSSCKKEIDPITGSSTNNEASVSTVQYIYNGQVTPLSAINNNAPEQVMFVASDETVYVFDNHEDFAAWGKTSSFSSEVSQIETKRTLALDYANKNGIIEEYKRTGVIKQDFLDYYASISNASKANKTEGLGGTLFQNSYKLGGFFTVLPAVPYVTLGTMNDRASSFVGWSETMAFYDGTWFSGKSLILAAVVYVPEFSKYEFDNKISSTISL